MIERPQVFGDDYVPNIVCREAEKTALENALEPITYGEPSYNCLLYGPTGTGKTATVRYMLTELERFGGEFRSAYVNCLSEDTRRAVLKTATEPLMASPSRAGSMSRQDLYAELCDLVDTPYVVVADEADHLSAEHRDALFDLYQVDGVSVVMVVNDRTQFLGSLQDKLHSRFASARDIQFDSYSEQELARIVEARANAGLQTEAINDTAIRTIAAVAGDARSAVQILHTAARATISNSVTPKDVVDAVPDARETLRDRALARLGDRHRYVFEILDNRGALRAGEINDRYAEVVGQELSQSARYRILSKLEEYELIVSEGETSGKTYRVRELPGGVPEIPV
jgi:Cdc6-like AAA superfamily ATPase